MRPRLPVPRPYPSAALPRIGRGEVEAIRALLPWLPGAQASEWAAVGRALGGAVTVRLDEITVGPAAQLAAGGDDAAVALRLRGGRLGLLAVESVAAGRWARAILGIDAPELPAPRPLTRLEEGAFELLVTALLGDRAVPAGSVASGARARLLAELGEGPLVVHLLVDGPPGRARARLQLPAGLRLAGRPPLAFERLQARRQWLEGIAMTATLERCRSLVERGDLRRLEIGDVLLFDEPAGDAERLRLRVGGGGYLVRRDAERLTVTSHFRLYEPMTKTEVEADERLLGELPVELVCELGRVTMNGRELIELAPGAVITLARPLAGPVDLTVGGRLVAEGELVDVDGELGVRLVRLALQERREPGIEGAPSR